MIYTADIESVVKANTSKSGRQVVCNYSTPNLAIAYANAKDTGRWPHQHNGVKAILTELFGAPSADYVMANINYGGTGSWIEDLEAAVTETPSQSAS